MVTAVKDVLIALACILLMMLTIAALAAYAGRVWPWS